MIVVLKIGKYVSMHARMHASMYACMHYNRCVCTCVHKRMRTVICLSVCPSIHLAVRPPRCPSGCILFKSTLTVLCLPCSGLMVFKKSQSRPEITAQSGSAYLHFYSDAAYNMSGFNITFKYISHCTHTVDSSKYVSPLVTSRLFHNVYVHMHVHTLLYTTANPHILYTHAYTLACTYTKYELYLLKFITHILCMHACMQTGTHEHMHTA